MRRLSGIWSAANAVAAALLAPTCAVCEALLEEPLHGCVCRNCWAAVRFITPPVCDRCGDPLPRPVCECRQCSNRERVVERSRAVGEYEGTLRGIIHALKYDGRRSLAGPLAGEMKARAGELLAQADCVTPVPLHWWRQHRRGFNQARELARHLELPVVDVLTRTRHTRAQVELAAEHRRTNVQEAFGLRRPYRSLRSVHGLTIVLVDDVSTTGATLEECANVLKTAGASKVYAVTAARVISCRF